MQRVDVVSFPQEGRHRERTGISKKIHKTLSDDEMMLQPRELCEEDAVLADGVALLTHLRFLCRSQCYEVPVRSLPIGFPTTSKCPNRSCNKLSERR